MGHVVIAPAISIHALREEGDAWRWLMVTFTIKFLSTPSARRATAACGQNRRAETISIHALREEGDGSRRARGTSGSGISIHALREEGDPYFIRSVAFL